MTSPDSTPTPVDLPRRKTSTLALVIAGGVAGVALGLTGISSAATPTPSPSSSAGAAAVSPDAPGLGGRDCPEDQAGGGAAGDAASDAPSTTTTPSQAPTSTPAV